MRLACRGERGARHGGCVSGARSAVLRHAAVGQREAVVCRVPHTGAGVHGWPLPRSRLHRRATPPQLDVPRQTWLTGTPSRGRILPCARWRSRYSSRCSVGIRSSSASGGTSRGSTPRLRPHQATSVCSPRRFRPRPRPTGTRPASNDWSRPRTSRWLWPRFRTCGLRLRRPTVCAVSLLPAVSGPARRFVTRRDPLGRTRRPINAVICGISASRWTD